MIVHKIHVNNNVVRIGYGKNEDEIPQEYTLKSNELARPELYDAMQNIFTTRANSENCFAAGCYGDIEDITIKYNRENRVDNYVLSGTMYSDDGLVAAFKTGKIHV